MAGWSRPKLAIPFIWQRGRPGFRSPAFASRISSLPSAPVGSVSAKSRGNPGLPPPARRRSDRIWSSEPRAIGSGGIAITSSNCMCLNSLKGARYRDHYANWRWHAALIKFGTPVEHTVNAFLCVTIRTRSSPSITPPASPAPDACGPAMKFRARMP